MGATPATPPLLSQRQLEALRAGMLASPKELERAWKAGELWWLLDANQLRTYRVIRRGLNTPFWRYILRWARRTGKTWVLLVIALEELIRRKGIRINIAASTKKSLEQIIWPLVHEMLASCPVHLRPKVNESNGTLKVVRAKAEDCSVAVFAGCDDAVAIERLRGTRAHLNIVEEAGVIERLKYLLVSILNPQLETTGGCTLINGTPPATPGHEFATMMATAAAQDAADGTPEARICHRTYEDNPRMTADLMRQYLASDADLLGLSVEEYMQTADFRREWKAEVLTDPELAVFPEATEEALAEMTYEPDSSPMFFDRYVSMDLGFSPDWTGILFAYWDFPAQKLVIQDELLIRRVGDTELAETLAGKWTRVSRPDGSWQRVARVPFVGAEAEKYGTFGKLEQLWGEHPPFLMVADNNYPMTLAELGQQHGLVFLPTAKDERAAQIVNVRRWLNQRKFVIHPRCKQLRLQSAAAINNKSRTDFERTSAHGHFDLCAALIYLVRNVLPHVDRVPSGWGMHENLWRRPRAPDVSNATATLRQVFGGRA